jgi:uncharacterized protein YjeT (DUF2065 family)
MFQPGIERKVLRRIPGLGAGPGVESVAGRAREGSVMDLGTPTVYEAVTRRMVESVAEELKEIKSRLNGLLFMVAGAILVDTVLRLVG